MTSWRQQDDGTEADSPEEAVATFLEAQAAGDCEALLDVLSERTWSDGGRLDRAEFLGRCPDVVDRNATEVDLDRTLGPVEEVEGAILVRVPAQVDGETPTSPYIPVVREDGDCKVEPTREDIQLGRSPRAVVADYMLSLAEGDGEELLGTVSEETWSDGGALGREDFLSACEAGAVPVPDPPGLDGEPFYDPAGESLSAAGRDTLGFSVLVGEERFNETVTLVVRPRGRPSRAAPAPGQRAPRVEQHHHGAGGPAGAVLLLRTPRVRPVPGDRGAAGPPLRPDRRHAPLRRRPAGPAGPGQPREPRRAGGRPDRPLGR